MDTSFSGGGANPLSVSVIGWELVEPQPGKAAFGLFRVLVQKNDLSWFVKRRYAAFDELNRALRRADVPPEALPELPPKRMLSVTFKSKVDPGHMEARRAGLERYLQQLVANRVDPERVEELDDFLEYSEHCVEEVIDRLGAEPELQVVTRTLQQAVDKVADGRASGRRGDDGGAGAAASVHGSPARGGASVFGRGRGVSEYPSDEDEDDEAVDWTQAKLAGGSSYASAAMQQQFASALRDVLRMLGEYGRMKRSDAEDAEGRAEALLTTNSSLSSRLKGLQADLEEETALMEAARTARQQECHKERMSLALVATQARSVAAEWRRVSREASLWSRLARTHATSSFAIKQTLAGLWGAGGLIPGHAGAAAAAAGGAGQGNDAVSHRSSAGSAGAAAAAATLREPSSQLRQVSSVASQFVALASSACRRTEGALGALRLPSAFGDASGSVTGGGGESRRGLALAALDDACTRSSRLAEGSLEEVCLAGPPAALCGLIAGAMSEAADLLSLMARLRAGRVVAAPQAASPVGAGAAPAAAPVSSAAPSPMGAAASATAAARAATAPVAASAASSSGVPASALPPRPSSGAAPAPAAGQRAAAAAPAGRTLLGAPSPFMAAAPAPVATSAPGPFALPAPAAATASSGGARGGVAAASSNPFGAMAASAEASQRAPAPAPASSNPFAF